MGFFDTVRKTRVDAHTKAAALRSEIEQLQTNRASLQHAPACRADVKAALAAHVAGMGAGYRQALEQTIISIARQPMRIPDASNPGESTLMYHSLLGAADPSSDKISVKALDQAFAVLFGGFMTAALDAMVDTAEWPGPEGLPLAKRATQVQRLNARIDALLIEEQELFNEATALGLSLSDNELRYVPR